MIYHMINPYFFNLSFVYSFDKMRHINRLSAVKRYLKNGVNNYHSFNAASTCIVKPNRWSVHNSW